MAYTEEQINEKFQIVINDITEGHSLRKALGFQNISSSTFYQWIDNCEEKQKQYARACEDRADKIFDEILEIADKQDADIVEVDGNIITNHNVIARSRLQVDARKWALSKMNPKKYGEKNTTILEGGEKPIEINFVD